MTRDRRHYVPAALIGRFAYTQKSPVRDSQVAVHDFTGARLDIGRKADNVGWRRNLYRGELLPGFDMDGYFKRFETMSLTPGDQLDAAKSGDVPALAWAQVAAYITSQLVRNPDLEDDIADLVSDWSNVLAANPLDFQRIGAAVYRARWELVHTSKDLLLGDRGVTIVSSPDWKDQWGYFIPLRKRFGVRIGGGPYPKAVKWRGAEWRVDIPVVSIGDQQTDILNGWTWATASTEIYASSLELLDETNIAAAELRKHTPDLAKYLKGGGILTLPLKQRREDEMLITWLPSGIKPPGIGDATEMSI